MIKINKKYIAGFSLVEMLISMLITAMATAMMMFVFNESQKKFFNDSMELDIAVYCDKAVKEISNIVNDATIEVQQLADWDGNNCYKIAFYDTDKNGEGIEREITIRLSRTNGFMVKEGNTDVTNTIFDGVLINGGSINFGAKDPNTLTTYVIDDWGIDNLTADSLYHQINPSKTNAMSLSSYEIWMQVEIQTEENGSLGNTALYKYKKYSTRSFSPGLYLREKSKRNQSGI
tara:strand:+ start:94 stop:789 length:696 start_codon:yes stop_codon:yes gene_type:complete